jgi:hypothetical protein
MKDNIRYTSKPGLLQHRGSLSSSLHNHPISGLQGNSSSSGKFFQTSREGEDIQDDEYQPSMEIEQTDNKKVI